MTRVVAAFVFLLGLTVPAAMAEPRARDDALISASILSAQQPLDACGGRDLLDHIVPNGPFLEACKFHDACYRSGALDQGRCDADFLTDMRDACDRDYPVSKARAQNAACRVGAGAYYKAVNSRFGSMLYPGGRTDGALGAVTQRVTRGGGTPHLEACAQVTNTANRKLRYYLTLHDAKGKWVATAPALKSAALQPGDSQQLCASTALSFFRSAENIGPAYAVTLKVDDPATINPFGDLVSLDRMDCDTASGACRKVDP
ncbi:MAG: hypothetical protein CVT79_12520 [Alphaproteobacteria bacterium HGW-Alphaproteobacteria-18]|nr:MAG: hypothetical protein CVT79_12520 [Alphaproteobacteria bacterium HGW-Alphaproteobacteria-18]